jgi:hypothetical protein
MAKYTIRHDKIETTSIFQGKENFALGVTIGALGVIFAFVAFEFFWGTQDSSEYLSNAPLVISLLVAMASTYFAANALLEQRRVREAATDPVLIVHLGQREDAPELITFNVSNAGAGAALKVQLLVETPEDNEDDWKKRSFFHNIFCPREPFTAILQGQSVEFSLALGWHLLGQGPDKAIDKNLPINPLPPFKAKLTYEDLAGGEYNSEFTIDVREMLELGANQSPQMRIAKALEKIAKK